MGNYDIGIVDGQNLFYKSFSVHKELSVNIDGTRIFTGGTYGFVQFLVSLKRDYLKDDSKIVIAWDRGHKRRSQMYPEYKANRNKDEWADYDNFIAQRFMLQQILLLIGVPQAYKEGEEADDIVGTLSRTYSEEGNKVLIVSADKDFQQLIDDNVDLLAHKGRDNIKIWNKKSWSDENGFLPEYFAFILGLMGDTGDNIPGVKGIGTVSAYKIVKGYVPLLKEILEFPDSDFKDRVDNITKKILGQEKMFKLSYDLALINKYIKGIRIRRSPKNLDELETQFELLKFHNLLSKKNWECLTNF